MGNDLTREKLAEIFFALSDPKRLEIVGMLAKKRMNCSELKDVLDVALPTITYHLKILIQVGIVEEARDGSWKYGVLHPEVIEKAFKEMNNNFFK